MCKGDETRRTAYCIYGSFTFPGKPVPSPDGDGRLVKEYFRKNDTMLYMCWTDRVIIALANS